MSYFELRTDAFNKTNETVTYNTTGEWYTRFTTGNSNGYMYLIGPKGGAVSISVHGDKGGIDQETTGTFDSVLALVDSNVLYNQCGSYFTSKYSQTQVDAFFNEYAQFKAKNDTNVDGAVGAIFLGGIPMYPNSISGYGIASPNDSGYGSPQSNDYNQHGPLQTGMTKNATNVPTNNFPFYDLFAILSFVRETGFFEFSEIVDEMIDDNMCAIASDKSVAWSVNIDGAENPNISLAWTNELQADIEQASVELRCYSSGRSDHVISRSVFESSQNAGRYSYYDKPVSSLFDNYYKDYGSGVDWYDKYTEFLQNKITSLASGQGAVVFLFFRMTFIANGEMNETSWCYAKIDYYGRCESYGLLKGEFNDGSTVSVTTGNADDFYNEFTDDIDGIDTNNYGSNAGFTTLTKSYLMGTSRLKQLGNFLWNDDFTKKILDVNDSPIQNIVGCRVFPFSISAGSDEAIVLGNVNTGVMGQPINENQTFEYNIGSFKVDKKYNNWIDYMMTSVGIFLPFSGFHNLDTNEIMDKTISIKLYVDVLTGVCKYVMFVNNVPTQEFAGQIGFDIPITASNRSQVELAQLTSFASAATSAYTGNLGGVASGIMNGVQHPATQFTTVGSISPTVNMMTTHDVFIVIERPIVQYPSNYGHVYGYPCQLKKTLNNLTGFTKCANVDVSGVPCTQIEKDMIKAALEKGVIL